MSIIGSVTRSSSSVLLYRGFHSSTPVNAAKKKKKPNLMGKNKSKDKDKTKTSPPPPGLVLLSVTVQPSAATTEIVSVQGEEASLRLNAPPVDGQANKELVKYLSKLLSVSKSQVGVASGHKSRNKVVSIEKEGLTKEQVLETLNKHV